MFIDNKYTKWYFKIIENAKNQNRKKKNKVYYESHHIIPKSFGGKEEVLLTAKEHYICHLLLCKITCGTYKYKMINALIRMTYSKSNNQERYTAKSYSLVRSLIAEKNSVMFKGKKKSEEVKSNMKGKSGTWVRTEESKYNSSEAQKKRFISSSGTFKDKKHSEETKQKWSEKRKGIKPPFDAKGTKWYTNGEVDKMCKSDNIPEGFVLGRVKNRKESLNGLASKKSPTQRSSENRICKA